jgi:hypothetical protein
MKLAQIKVGVGYINICRYHNDKISLERKNEWGGIVSWVQLTASS